METVDFTFEIHKIREKIKLMVDIKNAIDNESRMKQSVEMLESIMNRITDLANTDTNSNNA